MSKCVNFLHILRTPFTKNTSGWQLLILGNWEITRKFLKCLGLMASTQPSTQEPSLDVSWQKPAKSQL